jgi:hypothetical protein
MLRPVYSGDFLIMTVEDANDRRAALAPPCEQIARLGSRPLWVDYIQHSAMDDLVFWARAHFREIPETFFIASRSLCCGRRRRDRVSRNFAKFRVGG